MEAGTYTIIKGPSSFDMAISLFRGYPDDVTFFLKNEMGQNINHPFSCFLTQASTKDERDAKKWILGGYYLKDGWKRISFTAQYSVSTRKGTLKVLATK